MYIVVGTLCFRCGLYRVRNFRGRVSNFNQSGARKQRFLASDWLKFVTLPRKYRTLLVAVFFEEIAENGEGSNILFKSSKIYDEKILLIKVKCHDDFVSVLLQAQL